MAKKKEICELAGTIQRRIAELCHEIAKDPELTRRAGSIFPHTTIHSNLELILNLFSIPEANKSLTVDQITYIADIGCGNGELSFLLSQIGYKVTAVDYSCGYSQQPYIVKRLAKELDIPIALVDFSVDRCFSMTDLKSSCISNEASSLPANLQKFDLTISLGLLYHLKNPFAFVESLSNLTRHCVIHTWVFTHLPPAMAESTAPSLAYLLDAEELNDDASNYWIFNDTGVTRLFRRCGFEVISKLLVPNNAECIGTPHRMELLMRGFYLLKSLR